MVVRRLKLLVVIVLFLFAVSLYLLYKDMNSSTARRVETHRRKDHLLCVLIPYRNRWEELEILIPRLQEFLDKQAIQHHFVVLNQTDNYRFNRASLINVGWFEADRLGCDYFVMHDVDIVPLNPQLDYRYPGKDRIKHISAGKYHPIKRYVSGVNILHRLLCPFRYDYPKFIGGVLMLPMELYKRVDGMSNKYWGWGLEDDEFFLRLKEANLTERIDRPTNLTTDRSNTFMHVHGKDRKRDYAVYHKQVHKQALES
ncbi:beta-1,4-galactosyltransferase VII [Aphelenchoides avenae]|nr:beta-1,4-galactosyltransferase VII [Aphelenchus avenae]